MSALEDAIRGARQTGDLDAVVALLPYAQFLGLTIENRGGDVIARMRYSESNIGNAMLPALHGGTLGALLESAAIFRLLLERDAKNVPKTINLTVEYLRSARPRDTFARAEITRQGRRVANVRAIAWQEDPARPVAAAQANFLLAAPAED